MRPSAALILVLVVLITWCVVVTTASPHGDMMVEKLKKARSREFAKPDPPAGPSGASEQAKGQQPPYTAPEAATVDAAPPSGSGNKDEVEVRSHPDPIAQPPHSDVVPAAPAAEPAAAHIHATGETDAESRAHESVAHDDTPKVEPAQEVLHQPPQVDATAPTTAAPEVHEGVPATAEAPAAEAPVADANTAAPPATAVDVQSEEKAEQQLQQDQQDQQQQQQQHQQQQDQEVKHDDPTNSDEPSKVADADASAQPTNKDEQRPPEAAADTGAAEAQPPVAEEGQRAADAEQAAQAEEAAASPDTAADATAAATSAVEEAQQEPPTNQGAAPATVAEEASPPAAVVQEEPHHDVTPPSVETVPEQPPQYHHEDHTAAEAAAAPDTAAGASPATPLPHRGGGVAQPPRHEVDAPTVDAAVVSGETPTVADHPSDSAEQAEPEPQQEQQQQPEAQVVEQEVPDQAQVSEPAQAENEHQPHIGVPDQQSPPAQEEQAPAAPPPSEVAPPVAAAPSSVTPQQHSRSRRNVNLGIKGKPDQQRTERRNPLMHKDASQDDKNRFGQNLRLNKAKGRATHLTASARSLLEVVNQATTGVGALPPHEPRDPLPSDPQIAEMGLVELEHYLHRLETTLSHLNTYCHEAAQSLNAVRDEKEREDAERQARLEQEAHERAERERTENEERERQAERERVERQLEIDRLKALSDHERNNREAATRARYRAEAELAAKNGPTAETRDSNDDAAASKRGALSTSQMLLYGGIGLGVALAIGLGLFLVARGRGKRKVQNAATKAAKDGGGNGGLAFVGTPVASPVAPVPTFHPQPHHQAPLAGTGDGMSLRNRALARFKVEDV